MLESFNSTLATESDPLTVHANHHPLAEEYTVTVTLPDEEEADPEEEEADPEVEVAAWVGAGVDGASVAVLEGVLLEEEEEEEEE